MTLRKTTLNIMTLSITVFSAKYNYDECRVFYYVECHYAVQPYAECHYSECRYVECHYSECRGAVLNAVSESSGKIQIMNKMIYQWFL